MHLSLQVSTGQEEEKANTPPTGDEAQSSSVSTVDVQLEGIGATTATPGPRNDPENDPGNDAEEQEEEEEQEATPCPLPRINPCLTVRGNTLYVFGGLLEVSDLLSSTDPVSIVVFQREFY